ncbi:MAG: hypothetical protein RMJ56_09980 [Gemmataceae bacterium]|nr:hypothetical protein [Gemmata sp.]MDW8197918.1 hypothetical protein [Gemmataceae bacterium]
MYELTSLLLIHLLSGPALTPQLVPIADASARMQPTTTDKKNDPRDEPRQGTVTGIVTAKGDTWIEVLADGEEKPRRYVPHWKGGLPQDGGGLDKAMLAEIQKVPLKSRVELKWSFEERPRVEAIKILKKGDDKK